MNIEVDTQADSMYIEFIGGEVHDTLEVGKNIFVDIDANGEPLGLEILFASKKLNVEDLANISVNVLKKERELIAS